MRKINFQNDHYYHICNRGVDKREIFCDEKDYFRFLRSMKEFNRLDTIESLYRQDQLRREGTKSLRLPAGNRSDLVPLADIICYCLNPNHFHLLLKQISEKGIQKYMHKLSLGYTQYINAKYSRSGSLFQGTYKATEIKSEAQLLYVSCYINGNPEIHGISNASIWQYSSCLDFFGRRNGTMNNKDIILKEYKNIADYKLYMQEVIKNSTQIKEELKKLQLE